MKCAECLRNDGYEGEPVQPAAYLFVVLGPPDAAATNKPEKLCGYHAKQAAEADIGFGWAVAATLLSADGQPRQFVSDDLVDEATLEVDGGYGQDGTGTRGYLVLTGDFVSTFEAYLANPDADHVSLRMDVMTARKLWRQLGEVV